ncbi:MAG: phospholipase D family protein [Acidobacteriia bacterium]|nr:phospholipase D family protein [Terriglobia bacterium]
MRRGGQVEIVAGLDEGITTRQGLELLNRYSTTAYVFMNPAATFHPKVYLFEIPHTRATAFVGSNNLTAGGLYTNYEMSLGVDLDLRTGDDREAYEHILTFFSGATDLTSGNSRRLTADVISDLVRGGRVTDERRPARGPTGHGDRGHTFPRTPVPPPPPIDPGLRGLIPVPEPTGRARAGREVVTEFFPSRVFVMRLGTRDARQLPGYSRDIFIPLAARDADPAFWGWPQSFRRGAAGTVGRYMQRRVRMLVRPARGTAQVLEDVRLYYYDIKHEFRLNCGRLIEGAQPGNLLVVQKASVAGTFRGRDYDFEATVLGPVNHEYQVFARECSHSVRGSQKQWGYI